MTDGASNVIREFCPVCGTMVCQTWVAFPVAVHREVSTYPCEVCYARICAGDISWSPPPPREDSIPKVEK